MTNKSIKKSQKRIGMIIKGFEAVIKFIIKTNYKLEKGMEKIEKHSVTVHEAIVKAEKQLEQNHEHLIELENEVIKNKKLMSKFEEFIGGE